MPTKTINQTISTILAADAQYTVDIADNNPNGAHPGCAYVLVKLRDGEYQTVWLQNATRDVDGAPTGAKINSGVLTAAELTSLRAILTKVFNKATADAGYV